MAMNFNADITTYTESTRQNKTRNFAEFGSKKKLEEAGVLEEDKLNFVKKLRRTFSFSLHTGGRYLIASLYCPGEEKKYQFIVIDLQEMLIAECDSIKTAKIEVLKLVGDESAEPEAEESVEAQEVLEPEESPEAQEVQESPKKNRKSKKNTNQ